MKVIKYNYHHHQTMNNEDLLFPKCYSKYFAGINSFRLTTTL